MKKELKIGDHTVTCVTISDLAKMSGRKAITLRKLEESGVLPPANWRLPGVEIFKGDLAGTKRPGARVYTIKLAEKVAEVIRNEITSGIKISSEVKQKLRKLFEEELNEYKS